MANSNELKVTLLLMRENFEAGMKAANDAINRFDANVKKTGNNIKPTTTDLRSLTSTVTGFAAQLGIAIGVSEAFHMALKAIDDYAKQETALNRIELMLKNIGKEGAITRDSMDALGSKFIRMGQAEEGAYSGLRRLLQATRDASTAQVYLNDALAYSKATGADVGQVSEALARAYTGQYRGLRLLVLGEDEAEKSGAKFYELLKKLREDSKSGANAFDPLTEKTNGLKAAWDSFADNFGKSYSPMMTGMKGWLKDVVDYLGEAAKRANEWAGAYKALFSYRDSAARAAYAEGVIPEVVATGKAPPRPESSEDRRKRREAEWAMLQAIPQRPDFWPRGSYTLGMDSPYAYNGTLIGGGANDYAKSKQEREDWIADTERYRDAIDEVTESLSEMMLDLPEQGAAAFADFVNSALRDLYKLVMDPVWATLRQYLYEMFKVGLNNFRYSGAAGTGAAGSTGRGGGYNSGLYGAQGFGGPTPLPPYGVGAQPIVVTISDNATKFSQWCEIVYTTGGQRRMATR